MSARTRRAATASVVATLAVVSACAPKSSPDGSAPAPDPNTATSVITLTGDLHGTVEAALCTNGIASIAVHLYGDSETYHGSISANNFGFVGPDGAEFTLPTNEPKPKVSDDGQSFTVAETQLVDHPSGKNLSANGTVTCP